MLINPFGIEMLVRLVHPLNAFDPMLVTDPLKVTLIRPVHP